MDKNAFGSILQAEGLYMPEPVKPLGAYVPAVEHAGIIYVSGQLPMREGRLIHAGRIGVELGIEEAREAAKLCLVNCLAAVAGLGIEPHNLGRVVKLVGHIRCAEDFRQQAQVMNAASELCHRLYGEKGVHARAALGAFALPLGAAMELEAVFAL